MYIRVITSIIEEYHVSDNTDFRKEKEKLESLAKRTYLEENGIDDYLIDIDVDIERLK